MSSPGPVDLTTVAVAVDISEHNTGLGLGKTSALSVFSYQENVNNFYLGSHKNNALGDDVNYRTSNNRQAIHLDKDV